MNENSFCVYDEVEIVKNIDDPDDEIGSIGLHGLVLYFEDSKIVVEILGDIDFPYDYLSCDSEELIVIDLWGED